MAYGIDHLRREIEQRFNAVDAQFASVTRALLRLEGKLDTMPSRADFDAAKAALSAEITAVVQAITDLRAQLAAGNPITDQDLADIVGDNTQLLGAVPAPPTPSP